MALYNKRGFGNYVHKAGELKMADFAKKLKENFFEIIESIAEEVLISDGEGVVLWTNKGFEDFYDVDKKTAIGSTVYEMEERCFLMRFQRCLLRCRQNCLRRYRKRR